MLHEQELEEDKLRAGFSSALDALLAARTDGSGPFLHTDHMTVAQLGESESCAACHDGTASLDVDALAQRYSVTPLVGSVTGPKARP